MIASKLEVHEDAVALIGLNLFPTKKTRPSGGVASLKAVAGWTLPRKPSGKSILKRTVTGPVTPSVELGSAVRSSSRRPNIRKGGVDAGGGVMRLSLPVSRKMCGR